MNTKPCCDLDDFVKAMADESRQRILGLLENGELNVQDLTNLLGLSQPTVSHHLARLLRANLVMVRHDGREAFYRANPACVHECCQGLLGRFNPTGANEHADTD